MKKVLFGLALLAAALIAPSLARADIKIAVAGPLTGGEATFGKQFTDGADMAIEDINKAGGVLGQKLELLKGDDACEAKQAVAVANKMVGEKVAFVAGHFCSSTSIPASKVYAEENIIQISPASTNPKLTDERAGPNVFRVCGRDDQQGSVDGAYLAKNFKDKNIAVVHDKTAYGKGLADETQKAMNAAGKKEVLYESVTKGEKDFNALVSKLKQAKVDVIFYGGYHQEAGLIVRQMRDQGMNTILMGGDSLNTKEYADITGSAGDGTLFSFAPDPRKNPSAKGVVDRFKAKGIDPEGYVLYTYAAIQAWQQAVEKAKSIEPKNVIAALNSTEFDTVIGKFKFDKKGDPNLPPFAIYKFQGGNYEQIN